MGHGFQIIEQLDMRDIELLGQRRSVHHPGEIRRPGVVLKDGAGHAEAGGFQAGRCVLVSWELMRVLLRSSVQAGRS